MAWTKSKMHGRASSDSCVHYTSKLSCTVYRIHSICIRFDRTNVIINLYYYTRAPTLFTLFFFHFLYWSHFYFRHIHMMLDASHSYATHMTTSIFFMCSMLISISLILIDPVPFCVLRFSSQWTCRSQTHTHTHAYTDTGLWFSIWKWSIVKVADKVNEKKGVETCHIVCLWCAYSVH